MSISMMKRMVPAFCLVLCCALDVGARMAPEGDQPRTPSTASAAFTHQTAVHRVCNMWLATTNHGCYGTGFAQIATDIFSGVAAVSCEYPKNSGTQYTFSGAFWIGAVAGRDTLVSVGADGWQNVREMEPLEIDFGGTITRRSLLDPSSDEYLGALSQEDFISKYADTASNLRAIDRIDGRAHRPLGIEVTERSFGWSYDYADDFVLFDYEIKNNSIRDLTEVYMGIYCDADVGAPSGDNFWTDDICGFLKTLPSPRLTAHACAGDSGWVDLVNSAWIADNDGDYTKDISVPNVTATRVVRTPAESLNISFNWWVGDQPARDFGPMSRAKYRDLSTNGLGTPEGDRNKYFYMSNGEHDYDQVFTRKYSDPSDSAFSYWYPAPGSVKDELPKGADTRYLLSFGPFTLNPGQTVPISFCYVGGKNFHKVESNFNQNISGTYDPDTYYSNLYFDSLGINATWASWIYDNPGVDTDGDGNYGKYRICSKNGAEDTIWNEGDGVPDFRGAAPPDAPQVWLLSASEGIWPTDGKLTVRFNGQRSENSEDPFSQARDFEGYRVYLGRDERPSSITVIESWDYDNYNKYAWVTDTSGSRWELQSLPMNRQLLDSLYGFPNWNPASYTQSRPWRNPLGHPEYADSLFYFTMQDHNNSRLGIDTRITKRYPEAEIPPVEYFHIMPDSAFKKVTDTAILHRYYTTDGWMKYYEYQLTIENLLPTVPYYVNVTAFDFGAPSLGLGALETSPTLGIKVAFPQGKDYGKNFNPGDDSRSDYWVGQVYVYPNPYRLDGRYLEDGFEGQGPQSQNKSADRKRKVNFANLPPKCTIRIHTLDGDMVKEIEHDVQSTDPVYSHEAWDLITRNTQLSVSGLYYWSVEDESGNVQIGKLVLIM